MSAEHLHKFNINCLPYPGLSLNQLYDIMRLRQKVFVVEQNCPYLDADEVDKASWHLMFYNWDEQLIAYSRLIPKGIVFTDYASIGRVVVDAGFRGKNIGKQLVLTSIEEMEGKYGNIEIKISAQSYLLKFYESFGFYKSGEAYMEDGIPHTPMIKPRRLQ
jgi:ElaA protein